jgi:hypothetical protein
MIDVVYTFRFPDNRIEKAIKRATCSIHSMSKQIGENTPRILFLNCSKIDIKYAFKDYPVNYYHLPIDECYPMNKSKMINYMVKTHVRTLYFFLSDIDMVYPTNYIQRMLEEAYKAKQKYNKEVRVIPFVSCLQKEFYTGDFDDLAYQIIPTANNGMAPGNGLISTLTFKHIRGFDEEFVGWGHEDTLFNDRISELNQRVFAENIKTLHLFHTHGKKKEEEGSRNEKLWLSKLKNIKENIIGNNVTWGNIDHQPQISICIPAYEMNPYGVQYLDTLLKSIRLQIFQDYEVVISDHSQNNNIENLCDNFKDLPIRYHRYTEKFGNGPANTNNCLKLARGKYIKPMFQDDVFCEKDALTILYYTLKASGKKWIACSCNHIDKEGINCLIKDFYPHWNNKGKNNFTAYFKDPYIGSPSRVMWKTTPDLFFDESLIHYMDVDMWYRTGNILDAPFIFAEKHLISCRQWEGSITQIKAKKNPLEEEEKKLLQKYKRR